MKNKSLIIIAAFAFIGVLLLVVVSAGSDLGIDSNEFSLSEQAINTEDKDAFGGDFIAFTEVTDPIDPVDPMPVVFECDPVEGANYTAADLAGTAFTSIWSFETLPQLLALDLVETDDSFAALEGPVWHEGTLYFTLAEFYNKQPSEAERPTDTVDHIWHSLYSYTVEDDAVRIIDKTAGVNGLAIDQEGGLLAARLSDGTVSSFDPDTNEFTPLISEYGGKRFNAPNDIVTSDKGIYFTDPSWGAPEPAPQVEYAYFVNTAGEISVIPEGPDRPNGITLNAAEDALFIGGEDGVWMYVLGENGVPSAPQQVITENARTDGMTRDCAGNIYVAAGQNQIIVLDSSGARLGEIVVDETKFPTNLAFGGPEGKTLFFTEGDQLEADLYSVEMRIQGYPY